MDVGSDPQPAIETDATAADEDEYTPEELVDVFRTIWRNERYAPELLPEKLAVVDALLDTIKNREEELKKQPNKDPDHHFHSCLQKMEHNRIRYMVANYLRCRLEKIDSFAVHLASLHEMEQRIRLSDPERKYLDGLLRKMQDHLKASFEVFLPANVSVVGQDSGWRKNPPKPKLNTFVVIRPKETLERIMLPNLAEPADLEKGNQYLLRYNTIREYIFTNDDDLRKCKAELL